MELAVATTLSTLNVKDVIDVMPGPMKSSVALLNQADLGWYSWKHGAWNNLHRLLYAPNWLS